MTHEFDAEIREGRGGGAWIEIPFDVKEAFGSARPKIRATFDGEPYRGSISPMAGRSVLGIRKAIRQTIGKEVGDTLRVAIVEDSAPRTITLPADLRTALDAAGALEAFEQLSYTHRREHVESIEEAKRPETRERRVRRAIEALTAGGAAGS